MKKIIVANWKCNPQIWREAERMFLALRAGDSKLKAEVVVCPPNVYSAEAAKIFKAGKIKLGAQDCSLFEGGAYTGEVSAAMLRSLGAGYVILGHSERRALGENNETIAKKIKIALKNNLTALVLLGETEEQKKKQETFLVLEQQVKEVLGRLNLAQMKKVIIVYEPIWAISANKGPECSADEALTAVLFLRKLLTKMVGAKAGKTLPVLYGGSVNSQNAKGYLSASEAVSGLLVGGASLDIKEFLKIIKNSV